MAAPHGRSAGALRGWRHVHTWTSLVCTLFLLMLCITGLPLIFHHELEPWLGTLDEPVAQPADAAQLDFDAVIARAQAARPDDHVHLVFTEAGEDRIVYVGMGATPAAPFSDDVGVYVDWVTGAILGQQRFGEGGVLDILLKLHVDLFAGLPGKLFLGVMALVFLVALVSGVVLYAPFLRGRSFGAVRRDRGPRRAWLDLHNALGALVLAWAFVVGATGVLNTWADLLLKLWQADELVAMTAPYRGQPPPTRYASLAASVRAAQAAAPAYEFAFATYPGTAFSGDHHYAIFLRGSTPLTSRLLRIVLVDAASAEVSVSRGMPWYITTLLLSQPLHFGDYGGLPLKIVWALLDVLTIVVLTSGLYLWWRRVRPRESQGANLATEPARAPAAVRTDSQGGRRWWPVPLLLGIASLVGLASALLADGIADWVSWFALGGVALLGFALLPARRPAASQSPDTALPRSEPGA